MLSIVAEEKKALLLVLSQDPTAAIGMILSR